MICLVGQQIGDAAKIPSWLQEQHCPASSVTVSTSNGLTGYQQLLVDNAPAGGGSCSGLLLDYFRRLNSPVTTQY